MILIKFLTGGTRILRNGTILRTDGQMFAMLPMGRTWIFRPLEVVEAIRKRAEHPSQAIPGLQAYYDSIAGWMGRRHGGQWNLSGL